MSEADAESRGDTDAVFDVLRNERRANPYLIREQTELGKGEVNTALNALARNGRVRRVTRGLWEATDPGETVELQTAHDAIQRALADLPDDVPGRVAVEDAAAAVERATDGHSTG